MFRKLIATSGSWVPVPLRLAMAAVFIAHGSQKVLGSWGGPGFKTFTSGETPFPFMRPAWLWLSAAALSELVGGVLLLLGLLTRVAAFLIACTMLTAIIGVHWGKFFSNTGGYEYALTLFAISLALMISGGGALSVDHGLAGPAPRGRR
jgi:putative oxidoreductase